MVENVYEKHGVRMKGFEDMSTFMNQMKLMHGDRPLLTDDIYTEI